MRYITFVLLLVAVLLPRPSSAASIDVDNSEYGIQHFNVPCANFSDSSGMNAHCFFSNFSNGDYGFLVGFNTSVSNVEVAFSNASILDAGLVICSSDPDDSNPCGSTPTWDLDVSASGPYANYQSLFSSTTTSTSAIFDLNGTIPATNVHGNEVGFLILCTPGPNGAAASDCDGVNITVRSLTQTAPVPEPSSLLLCGSGAAMFARRLRNRRVR